jgi:hypothetical protein
MARFIKCDCRQPKSCPGVESIWLMKSGECAMNENRRTAVLKNGKDTWIAPVFGDVVNMRDFLEERRIERSFPLSLSETNNFSRIRWLFWCNGIFHEWIVKSGTERLGSIQQGFQGYQDVLEMINCRLSSVDVNQGSSD